MIFSSSCGVVAPSRSTHIFDSLMPRWNCMKMMKPTATATISRMAMIRYGISSPRLNRPQTARMVSPGVAAGAAGVGGVCDSVLMPGSVPRGGSHDRYRRYDRR